MTTHQSKRGVRLLALLLSLALILMSLPGLALSASAANTVTSLGFAQRGLDAYRENWVYVYGGKGGDSNGDGIRESDCAGLLYSYFIDNGVTSCMGGASSQARRRKPAAPAAEQPAPAVTRRRRGGTTVVVEDDKPAAVPAAPVFNVTEEETAPAVRPGAPVVDLPQGARRRRREKKIEIIED